MKDGTLDKARCYIDLSICSNKEIQKIMIKYYTLRNKDGNYLGCMNTIQNIYYLQN